MSIHELVIRNVMHNIISRNMIIFTCRLGLSDGADEGFWLGFVLGTSEGASEGESDGV